MTTDRGDELFESPDGDDRTLRQIVYRGWHEGGVEQTDGGFVVDGVEYTRVTDGE